MATSEPAPASPKAHPVRTGTHPLRKIVGCVLLASAIALTSSAFGQTNADPDVLQAGGFHNLTPFAKVLPTILWSFGSILLVIAAVAAVLRYRVNRGLYKTAADAHWQDDAREEAAVPVDESEVIEACAHFGKPAQADDGVKPSVPEVAGENHGRLCTPASGPVWDEPMLNAFLSSCLRANCLGRAWQEEAARRQPGQQASVRRPDPREAEFIRKLKARWQEFHIDPENGIFVEHVAGGSGRSRVCLIKVSREKHAVTRAALNAGFVIENVGRYLKSSDLVYPSGLGSYHAPNRQELTALSAEEKKGMLRLKNISDPWQAMIAGGLPREQNHRKWSGRAPNPLGRGHTTSPCW